MHLLRVSHTSVHLVWIVDICSGTFSAPGLPRCSISHPSTLGLAGASLSSDSMLRLSVFPPTTACTLASPCVWGAAGARVAPASPRHPPSRLTPTVRNELVIGQEGPLAEGPLRCPYFPLPSTTPVNIEGASACREFELRCYFKTVSFGKMESFSTVS